jgi:site-specific DNA-methyltransferase (adenine-specific)
MKPYYQEKGITIYHGDCREVLPQLEHRSVDLVATDPPYGIGFKYDGEYTDTVAGYADWLRPVLMMSQSCLKLTGAMAVFQSAKWACKWSEWFPWEWRLIALPKKFVQMNTAAITWATDYVLYWTMPEHPVGHQDWQPEPARDWFVSTDCCVPRSGFERGHPCPRPPDMMEYLVSIAAPPGSLLLDPFMGSGTTLRAAKDLGRRAIGIEIEEKYCEIAAKRLAQEVLEFT